MIRKHVCKLSVLHLRKRPVNRHKLGVPAVSPPDVGVDVVLVGHLFGGGARDVTDPGGVVQDAEEA